MLTKDTLYPIRGDQYVASKIRLLEADMTDLRQQRGAAQGREGRALEKQIAELEDVLEDLRAFAKRIDAILQRSYTPHIDDGVLLNMAPLWELLPSWQAEPKKCREALARGEYDWSHRAMDHWPERVRKKCQSNKILRHRPWPHVRQACLGLLHISESNARPIPHADRAIVDIRKLRDYCLNPAHDEDQHKARVFAAALGLTIIDAEALRVSFWRWSKHMRHNWVITRLMGNAIL